MARLAASNSGSVQGAGIPLGTKPGAASTRESEAVFKSDQMGHLRDNLSKIEQVNQTLQRFSVVVLTATILSLGSLFVALLVGKNLNWLAAGSLLTGCLALYGCASHEVWRKRGDLLFEEISDGVERAIVAKAGEPEFQGEGDLLYRARAALRGFAHAGDLPFIPGKFGPTIYAALNLLIPILILFLSRLPHS